jgi:uncharacterized protein (TIGR02246 family)
MADTRAAGPDTEAIHQLYKKWFGALEGGDVEGFLALLTDDFILKAPGQPPVSDRAAFRRALEGLHAMYSERVRYTLEEIEVSGTMAWVRLTEETTLTPKRSGQELRISGTHLAILARQPDGGWKVRREVSSLDHP